MRNNFYFGRKFKLETEFELQILEVEVFLNLSQIYWRFKLVWKNMINFIKFLFALTFQNVNLNWHVCMAKSEVSIQDLLGLGLKEKWKEGLNLNLTKTSSLALDSQQLQDEILWITK
jgi:hypothetical protein